MKWAALAVALVALAGCPRPVVKSDATVTEQQLPKTVPELIKAADEMAAKQDSVNMQNALVALDKAHTLDPKNYEAAWKAARAALWLADELYDDKNKRAHYAGAGAEYAKAAIDDNGAGVEGYYYAGMNIGLLATTKTIGGKFDVPKVRDAEKKAASLDDKYDHGGPYRVLGSLYSEAPPWPASIGDTEQGVKYLKKALELGPDYPLNNLRLGRAYAADGQSAKALEQYNLVLEAQPKPEYEHMLPKWKRMAHQFVEDVTRKQSYSSDAGRSVARALQINPLQFL